MSNGPDTHNEGLGGQDSLRREALQQGALAVGSAGGEALSCGRAGDRASTRLLAP